jgi:hypothetical protein
MLPAAEDERAELLALLLRQEGLEAAPVHFALRPRPEHLPLSFAQERLWLLERLEVLGSAYNVSVAIRLSGLLNAEALEQSFATLVERHESAQDADRGGGRPALSDDWRGRTVLSRAGRSLRDG